MFGRAVAAGTPSLSEAASDDASANRDLGNGDRER
jgi:hypothetical protein